MLNYKNSLSLDSHKSRHTSVNRKHSQLGANRTGFALISSPAELIANMVSRQRIVVVRGLKTPRRISGSNLMFRQNSLQESFEMGLDTNNVSSAGSAMPYPIFRILRELWWPSGDISTGLATTVRKTSGSRIRSMYCFCLRRVHVRWLARVGLEFRLQDSLRQASVAFRRGSYHRLWVFGYDSHRELWEVASQKTSSC